MQTAQQSPFICTRWICQVGPGQKSRASDQVATESELESVNDGAHSPMSLSRLCCPHPSHSFEFVLVPHKTRFAARQRSRPRQREKTIATKRVNVNILPFAIRRHAIPRRAMQCNAMCAMTVCSPPPSRDASATLRASSKPRKTTHPSVESKTYKS